MELERQQKVLDRTAKEETIARLAEMGSDVITAGKDIITDEKTQEFARDAAGAVVSGWGNWRDRGNKKRRKKNKKRRKRDERIEFAGNVIDSLEENRKERRIRRKDRREDRRDFVLEVLRKTNNRRKGTN